MSNRLTDQAKQTLSSWGVAQAEWLRVNPGCDRCGCPDDRCMDGFHHDPEDYCWCLHNELERAVADGSVKRRAGE